MKKKILSVVLALSCVSIAFAATPYKGNPKSKIFHSSTCRYYNSKGSTTSFQSRESAQNSGYRPCKVCKP